MSEQEITIDEIRPDDDEAIMWSLVKRDGKTYAIYAATMLHGDATACLDKVPEREVLVPFLQAQAVDVRRNMAEYAYNVFRAEFDALGIRKHE